MGHPDVGNCAELGRERGYNVRDHFAGDHRSPAGSNGGDHLRLSVFAYFHDNPVSGADESLRGFTESVCTAKLVVRIRKAFALVELRSIHSCPGGENDPIWNLSGEDNMTTIATVYRWIKQLQADQRGQDLIEYALVAALVVVATVSGLAPWVGPTLSEIFSKVTCVLGSGA